MAHEGARDGLHVRRLDGPGWWYAGEPGSEPSTWVAGFLPWPLVANVAGNLLSGGVGAGLIPRSAVIDEQNILRAQAARAAEAHARQTPRGYLDSPAWVPPEDVPFRPLGGRGPMTTMRRVVEALSASSVSLGLPGPHPHRRAAMRILAAMSPTLPSGDPRPTPNPAIGLANAALPREAPVTAGGIAAMATRPPGTFQSSVKLEVGTLTNQLGDVSAMGAGRVRRLQQSELAWGCLFPYGPGLGDGYGEITGDFFDYGAQVPPPADLLGAVISSPEGVGYGRLAPFGFAAVAAWCLGVKLDPCLFNMGGGGNLNCQGYASGDVTLFTDVTGPVGSGVQWTDVEAGAPSWQYKTFSGRSAPWFLVPSGAGWDPAFYVSDAVAFVGAATPAAQQLYATYAVNVWPTEQAEVTRLGLTVDAGVMESCRRKSLALAAFSTGIAGFLRNLDVGFRHLYHSGGGVYDVIDTIELANEPEGFWSTDPSASPYVSYYEVARYMALLAGPIHAALPAMRFRCELHAWGPDSASGVPPWDDFEERTAWLGKVLGEGLTRETSWWAEVQRYQAVKAAVDLGAHIAFTPDADIDAWLATAGEAGFEWPPRIFTESDTIRAILEKIRTFTLVRPADLIHDVGEHWYHWTDRDSLGQEELVGYVDANRLASDVGALLRVGHPYRLPLGVTVGEIGFPALDPGGPVRPWDSGYYASTSPKFQAAMHVRYLATCLAAGAICANTFLFAWGPVGLPGGAFTAWNNFYTMGIHNDVYDSGGSFLQGTSCWARPAWFAIQRLSWLHGAASAFTLVYAKHGATVIQVSFPGPILVPEPSGLRPTAYRTAYIAWVDQYADEPIGPQAAGTSPRAARPGGPGEHPGFANLHFKGADRGFDLISLVPEVVGPDDPGSRGSPGVDANGYPLPAVVSVPPRGPFGGSRLAANPDWYWTDATGGSWKGALGAVSATGAGFDVHVLKADPVTAIAPLCILTDALLMGVT